MSRARKVFAVGVLAALGQDQLRGPQLSVKHLNDKGGVLGRKLELVVYDDGADPAMAVRLYEQIITQDKVELVLGPYSSPITDAVANVTEKHKLPMVVPTTAAATTSIYRKGRKFIFSMSPWGRPNWKGSSTWPPGRGSRPWRHLDTQRPAHHDVTHENHADAR